jgi:uncharacterized coiled-coil protein SlyX
MTEQTETQPPIDYEWHLAGPNGARFVLYPEKGLHTEDHVKKAQKWLYSQRDVVSLQIRWKKLGDKTEGPLKIPDNVIISELVKKIGGLDEYIKELEEKIISKETADNREIRSEVKREKIYKGLNEQLTKAKKEISSLRNQISGLVTRLNLKK